MCFRPLAVHGSDFELTIGRTQDVALVEENLK